MTVRELIEALTDIEPDWDVLIGYEGTHGPFLSIDLHPDGLRNPHWESVPESNRYASKEFMVKPHSVILTTH